MGKPNEGLLLLDKSLHVKTGNKWAARHLQRPLGSLIGKHVRELLPSEYGGGSLAKEVKLVVSSFWVSSGGPAWR